MWNQRQGERFAFEEALVKKYFPGFSLSYDHNGNPYFAGWTGTRGRRNNYKLSLNCRSSSQTASRACSWRVHGNFRCMTVLKL